MTPLCLNYIVSNYIICTIYLVSFGDTVYYSDAKSYQYYKTLTSLYQKCMLDKANTSLKEQYIMKMPNNFVEFNRLYGCSFDFKDDSVGLLSFKYDQHLFMILDKLELLLNNRTINKFIKISIGGKWEADAISLLQDILVKCVDSKLELTLEQLNLFSHKDQKSFWLFYFDGPHPPDKMPTNLTPIKTLDPIMYQLMEAALKQKQKEWEH